MYRAFSTSITSAILPSGRRNGNGLPVYLSEIGSMYLQSASGRLSTTKLRFLVGIVKINDGERHTRVTPSVLGLK